MTEEHAKLSASNAHRWTICPASVQEEAKYPNETSKYANEGIIAHEHAANVLTYLYKPNEYEKIKTKKIPVQSDMVNYINNYVQIVDYIIDDKRNNFDIYIEHKINYGEILPDSWGTIDCSLYDKVNNILHVIDFKYGKGVKVSIENNKQLILYSLGMQNYIKKKYKLKSLKFIQMYIVQPRIDNIIKTSLTNDDIDLVWQNYFKDKAKLTKAHNPLYIPSKDGCKFCRAKLKCKAFKNAKTNAMVNIFNSDYTLTQHDKYFLSI